MRYTHKRNLYFLYFLFISRKETTEEAAKQIADFDGGFCTDA